jgi:hypothetical protein
MTANFTPLISGYAHISVSPAFEDFGDINMGSTSRVQSFTLSNVGSANLVITSIGMTGGDSGMFSVTTGGSMPCPSLNPTIPQGSQCTIIVTFSPRLAGQKITSMRITSNDPDTLNWDVPLSGIALKWKCRVCGLEDAP